MIPAVDARATRRTLAALVVAVLVLAGCGDTPGRTPAATDTPGTSAPAPTDEPTTPASPEPPATDEPTQAPTDEPSGEPVETPGATSSPGSAAACSGNDDNRAFYVGVAGAVTWDVYCPVLAAGWFVDTGSFRLSGGGRMEIAYRGPGGQRLEIRQGAFCDDASGCPPPGSDVGAASFGDRAARLYDAGGTPASPTVFAAGGGAIGWEAVGIGMDGATLAAYTAAFAKVGE